MKYPICLICLRGVSETERFRIDYPGGRNEAYICPLSDFGLCDRHSPSAGVDVFFQDGRDELCPSHLRARSPSLRAAFYFAESQRVVRPSTPSRLRRSICHPRARCYCGAPDPQLGHLISVRLFALAGVDSRLSFFEDNVVPMCIDCNNAWIYAEWAPADVFLWHGRNDVWSRYWEATRTAVAVAHRMGIPIRLVPPHSTKGRIGTPVLATPSNPTDANWRVSGYVIHRWRQRLVAPSLDKARPLPDCCASRLIPQYLWATGKVKVFPRTLGTVER